MPLPGSGCWKSEVQVSTWAGSAEDISCLSQDLKEQELGLAHGLKGDNPSWWGGHGRVHRGKNLRLGLLISQHAMNRDQGEGDINIHQVFFFFTFCYSIQCPAHGMAAHIFPSQLILSGNVHINTSRGVSLR